MPVEAAEAEQSAPATTDPPASRLRSPAGRRAARALLPVIVALLLTAAHEARPAPYGDRLVAHARVAYGHGTRQPPLRATKAAVEAYDGRTGHPRWTYAREGRRPVAVLPARGHAIALWDDGLVTDTARGDGSAVRWHRALPGAAGWLADHGASGVLRPLGTRMLAVITPWRVAAYRIADGDLRWTLPARYGCSFTPERALRHGEALLIAQPCATGDSWTTELVAVDDLGRVTPHRTPLGNVWQGERHSADPLTQGKWLHGPVRLGPMAILLAH
ncbi:hypothetical protein [Streptomyces mirabilis]|uniref:hypothetical protein n=1 Tax=Streptomyces mirabilis TaxID=68239 RepID=UPI0036DD1852